MYGETLHNRHLRKAGVTTAKPVPGVVVPSWFHFPVRLDVCQRDAIEVDGTGAGVSCCPKAGMWLYAVVSCTATLKEMLAGESGISGLSRSAVLVYIESLVSMLWYDQCWDRAHRVGSKVVP